VQFKLPAAYKYVFYFSESRSTFISIEGEKEEEEIDEEMNWARIAAYK